MKVTSLGINYTTRKLLFQPFDDEEFAKAVLKSLGKNVEDVRNLTRSTTRGTTFRGSQELERRVVDLGDPLSVGWTYLIGEKDPLKDEIIAAMRPLAERRGMKDPDKPLILNPTDGDDWLDWLQDNYFSPVVDQQPHYVLIVGDPQQVPFRFQSILATAAAVGRLDFDSIDDLKAYVAKVIGLEKAAKPVVKNETIFFATDGGIGDPTYLSLRFMAEPLANYLQGQKIKTTTLFGDDATKSQLLDVLSKAKPALVYTASHGLGAPDEPFAVQKKVNGAICCQETEDDCFLTAEDIPANEPFLEGAAVFQFACFGYGTPAESDYSHWLGDAKVNTTADFVSALPKRLLANPRGPIAFIGHVDTAWLHGFEDPEFPGMNEVWSPRIEPFKKAVESLLGAQPPGHAMAPMSTRYDLYNAFLTNTYDRMQRNKPFPPDFDKRLVNQFITRSDAQNYMILGDPAAHLRIPKK
jgi:Peptidase family C25